MVRPDSERRVLRHAQIGFLQRLFCATVLRRAVKLDEHLFAKGLIPQVTREYVFMGYECVIR